MQSFNKVLLKQVKKQSEDNMERMKWIYEYLSSKVDWVVRICEDWVSVLNSLVEANRRYGEVLKGIKNYAPAELVADDFRNIAVSPDFSKIGVVMANFAEEKLESERGLEGRIEGIKGEFVRLVEEEGTVKSMMREMTDNFKMDVMSDMRKMEGYLGECVELVGLSGRLRQKFSVDEQKNKKLVRRLEETNREVMDNYVKCLMVVLSLNHMLEHYKTSCFDQLLAFINTGLKEEVGSILDLILRTTAQHLPQLDRDYLDACFTAGFDTEDLPEVSFSLYSLPSLSLETTDQSALRREMADRVGVLKTLKVQLLAKRDTLARVPHSQGLFGNAQAHLFTTSWYLEKISQEIRTYAIIIAGQPFPASGTSQFHHMFSFGRKVGAGRLLMFGGSIEDLCNHDIHPVILLCINHMRRLGLASKGLFRIPGGQTRTSRVMACLEAGIEVLDSSINTYASLFKAYFRGLKSSPIPLSLFLQIVPELHPHLALHKIRNLLFSLPRIPWLRLRYKFHFLSDVASHADQGQMNSENLATVFGMLYTSYFPNDLQLHAHIPRIIQLLIAHAHDLFPSSVPGVCYPDGLDYEEWSENSVEIPLEDLEVELEDVRGQHEKLRTDFNSCTFSGDFGRMGVLFEEDDDIL